MSAISISPRNPLRLDDRMGAAHARPRGAGNHFVSFTLIRLGRQLLRHLIGHDARARLHVEPAVLDHRRGPRCGADTHGRELPLDAQRGDAALSAQRFARCAIGAVTGGLAGSFSTDFVGGGFAACILALIVSYATGARIPAYSTLRCGFACGQAVLHRCAL
jgi:hypothetical protein